MNDHKAGDFDMDILNNLYGASSTIIPHRRYDLLSAEFINGHRPGDAEKEAPHQSYLGSPDEKWNGREILKEAKFVHFSDWPMPKPWLEPSEESLEKYQPKCSNDSLTGDLDCSDRDIWLDLRRDFSNRREVSALCDSPKLAHSDLVLANMRSQVC
jgi:hypothetical protein